MSFYKWGSRQKAFQGDQSLGKIVWPIMFSLRLCGVQPFSVEKKSNMHKRFHYFWKWNSVWTLYSFFMVLFLMGNLLLWLSSYIHLTFYSDKASWFSSSNESVNGTMVERFSIRLFPMIHPILCIVFLISSTFNTVPSIKIIENWDVFEIEYKKVFSITENIFNLQRRRITSATIGFTILIFTIVIIERVNQVNCSPKGNGYVLDAHICWLSGVFTVLSSILSYFEDAKQFALLYALVTAFKQVRSGVSGKTALFGNITMVYRLQSLIILIKTQAQLTAKTYSAPHVIYICLLFVTFCFSLFFGIKCVTDSKLDNDVLRQTTYLAIFLCCVGFSKLIIKARIAEQILSQEKLLSDEIRMMKMMAWENDLNFELETSMLVEFMEMRPSKISYGGILTLNNVLVLQMVGQVTTYLMVLAQFNTFK